MTVGHEDTLFFIRRNVDESSNVGGFRPFFCGGAAVAQRGDTHYVCKRLLMM